MIISTKCLSHCYDKVPSTCNRCDSFGIEMGHHLWSAFDNRIAGSKLSCTVLTPAVQESLFRQGNTESITNCDHTCLASYLLNAVGCQELTECARSPEEKAPCLFWNWGTKAASCNVLHWNMRNFIYEFHRFWLDASLITELSSSVVTASIDNTW